MNDGTILQQFFAAPFASEELILSILLAVGLLAGTFFIIGQFWGRCWNHRWFVFSTIHNVIVISLLSVCVTLSGVLYYGTNGCHFTSTQFEDEIAKIDDSCDKLADAIREDADGSLRQNTIDVLASAANPASSIYYIDRKNRLISMPDSKMEIKSGDENYSTGGTATPSGMVGMTSRVMLTQADAMLIRRLCQEAPSCRLLLETLFRSATDSNAQSIVSQYCGDSDINITQLNLKQSAVPGKPESNPILVSIMDKFIESSSRSHSEISDRQASCAAIAQTLFFFFLILLALYVAFMACRDIKTHIKD